MEQRWYMVDAKDFDTIDWIAASFNKENVIWNKQKTWFIFPMQNENLLETLCCNYEEEHIRKILASDDFGNVII